ncbi:hypothetical protein [Microbacterium sp. NPDC057944]|uniref:hypothetical protein n=1 Tax=Microbacterium sp. NPDC057944 TaxID=3346286 RepID=UPI0036DF0949
MAAIALAAGALVAVGPANPAAAATCNTQGSNNATYSQYQRTGGTCSQVRAYVSRLIPSTGQIQTAVGSWRSSGYSSASASNGYAYNSGFDVKW